MKTTFFFALLLSMLTIQMASAQGPKNIHIDFKIDAETIFNGGDVESNSELVDDNKGKTPNGNPKDFESEAYRGKFVIWEILDFGDNSSNYQVKFLDFPWRGDIDAFTKNPLQGGGRKAKAKVNDNSADGTIKYTIRFSIKSKNTGETRNFELDPRLRVR
ncbi:hypothetical protein [Algoriphagus sediminis]|uniref:DUF4625 domain-containing protein n=1 Tax=Algoriphagus sediminis TaxID=3057113 RepID=A0ABT7YE24_9BACT|nr:hypothetical protein [Algoriphagus sediminis]MDN3204449.1 hypothetical protein [Algoriphagus sediminis]